MNKLNKEIVIVIVCLCIGFLIPKTFIILPEEHIAFTESKIIKKSGTIVNPLKEVNYIDCSDKTIEYVIKSGITIKLNYYLSYSESLDTYKNLANLDIENEIIKPAIKEGSDYVLSFYNINEIEEKKFEITSLIYEQIYNLTQNSGIIITNLNIIY